MVWALSQQIHESFSCFIHTLHFYLQNIIYVISHFNSFVGGKYLAKNFGANESQVVIELAGNEIN